MAITGTIDGYIDENNNEYDLKDTTARTDITTINGKIPSSASSSNKLATANDIPSVTGKADKVSSATNGNFAGLDSNGNLTDSGKKSSDFATASSVTAIEGKIPSDASSSNKLATASDVASRVDWSSYAKTGVHNLLPYPYLFTTKSFGGVSYTVNSDGSVDVVNTSTDGGAVAFTKVWLKTGKYIVTGLNPQSGVYATLRDGETSAFIQNLDTASVEITISEEKLYTFAFNVAVGTNANARYYPMLRLASDTDSTYAPYAMTNSELTKAVTVVDGTCTDIVTGAEVISDQNGGNVVHVVGKMAFLNIALNHVTASAWSNLFTVPTSAKPKHAIKFRDVQQNKIFQMTTGGVVQCSEALSDAIVIITVPYIIA